MEEEQAMASKGGTAAREAALPPGFGSEEEYEFPLIINLCVLKGRCPCSCMHCPVGVTPPNERKTKFTSSEMAFSTFTRVVDEAADYPHSMIRIHGVGEPLLWRDLVKSLAYAKTKDVKTWIFTSLATGDRQILGYVANLANIIEVSVNSCDREDYRATKGVDSFDLVKENIGFISSIISKHRPAARLIASRVESGNREHDEMFINFWKGSKRV